MRIIMIRQVTISLQPGYDPNVTWVRPEYDLNMSCAGREYDLDVVMLCGVCHGHNNVVPWLYH